MKNILFICSRNQWRSLTAEKIYAKDERINKELVGLIEASVEEYLE